MPGQKRHPRTPDIADPDRVARRTIRRVDFHFLDSHQSGHVIEPGPADDRKGNRTCHAEPVSMEMSRVYGFRVRYGFASNSARELPYGARATPASVMIAEISSPGVTSNAGLYAPSPSGLHRCSPNPPTSTSARNSIGISRPLPQPRSIVV